MREIRFQVFDIRVNEMFGNELALKLLAQASVSPSMNKYYKFRQYTGLKDKNGKEIYEGDVVTWLDRTLEWYRNPQNEKSTRITDVVVFRDGAFKTDKYYELLINLIGNERFNLLEKSEVEVIGNVHESGDLLSVPNS